MSLLHRKISNRAFSAWSLTTAIEGLLVVLLLASKPSETESIFIFDLSLQLLLVVVGILLVSLFFLGVSIAHFYNFLSWNEFLNTRPKLVKYVFLGVFIFEIALLHLWILFPDYQFPILSGYLSRLNPVLVWFVLFFAQTFIFLAYFRGVTIEGVKMLRGNTSVIVTLVMVLLAWAVIAVTKIGITPNDFFWNMAGVPLLASQIWIAIGTLLAGWLLYSRFTHKEKRFQIPSLLIFIGIWVVSATIWINTPLAPSFNAPGPYPPSGKIYPFLDAALFDLGGQSAIYGRGLLFGSFFDRGLLMGFLAIIHKVFGQNYLVVASVQSAVFGIFPAFLYLLGEKMHSKSAGLMVATLGILKVSNAIAGGKWISTSHPKLLMTDFPTGIVLVLFTLFLVHWLLENGSKSYYLAGVGAVIGIGILLRTHVFFMAPAVFVLGLIKWKQQWMHGFRDVLVIVIAFFITISPWMWRNYQVAGEPLFFMSRFDRVIEERYQPQSHLDQNKSSSSPPHRALRVGSTISESKNTDTLGPFQFIPRHFVHNIITSVLVLPPSPVLDDLRHVVEKYPYWDRMSNPWQGEISFSMGIFLAMNLMVLSLGFGVVWKRAGFVAFVPFVVLLFYNLANAFARTSGGRYIVPVDWVIYFYYAIGLVEIIRFCISMFGFQPGVFFVGPRNHNHNKLNGKLNWRKTGLIILPFFLIVAALPIIEFTSPGEKGSETTASLMGQLKEISFFDRSGISQPTIEDFLNSPDAVLISGHGFYPRYYVYGQGEPFRPGAMTVYTARYYPRLVFTMLLPDRDKPVLFPIDEPRLYFPDAVEVIVGGCQVDQSVLLNSYFHYIDAAFVVILDETETIHMRDPEAPLECPMREPVCDNNHNCN